MEALRPATAAAARDDMAGRAAVVDKDAVDPEDAATIPGTDVEQELASKLAPP